MVFGDDPTGRRDDIVDDMGRHIPKTHIWSRSPMFLEWNIGPCTKYWWHFFWWLQCVHFLQFFVKHLVSVPSSLNFNYWVIACFGWPRVPISEPSLYFKVSTWVKKCPVYRLSHRFTAIFADTQIHTANHDGLSLTSKSSTSNNFDRFDLIKRTVHVLWSLW